MKLLLTILLLILEWLFAKVKWTNLYANISNQLKTNKSLQTDMIYFFLSEIGVTFFLLNILTFGLPMFLHRLRAGSFHFYIFDDHNLGKFASYLCALLILDFSHFIGHWVVHKFDFLWVFHKVHHSAVGLSVFTAERGHPLDDLFKAIIALPIFIIFKFNASALISAALTWELWTLIHHVNFKIPLGYFEYIFTTPQFHRIHHRADTKIENLGGIFTLWDILFSTANFSFRNVQNDLPAIGLSQNNYPQNFLSNIAEPIRESFIRVSK